MNQRILLVDDEPRILASLRRTLGERFDVVCASSGEEALSLAQTQGPFAAIVSDMRMPGMGGLELLREMRKRAPETVRLVLSGHADFNAAVAAVNEGAIFRFHTKPVPPEVLSNSLECALLRHREEQASSGRIDPGESLMREVSALRQALRQRQFRLYLQPQCQIDAGAVVGVEALVRWQHPERGLLAPGQFLAIAEAAGLMEELTLYMLNLACEEIRRWAADGLPPLRIAVNGTARNFADPNFPGTVRGILDKHGVPPQQIELELTEGAALEDTTTTHTVVQALAAMGVATSIDDFGTGHASLSWLRHVPVSKLKIDRIFIDDIVADPSAYRLLKNIVTMAHDLNLTVLAEGVETVEQLELVRQAGCDCLQGFLAARPMAAEDFPDWNSRHHGMG